MAARISFSYLRKLAKSNPKPQYSRNTSQGFIEEKFKVNSIFSNCALIMSYNDNLRCYALATMLARNANHRENYLELAAAPGTDQSDILFAANEVALDLALAKPDRNLGLNTPPKTPAAEFSNPLEFRELVEPVKKFFTDCLDVANFLSNGIRRSAKAYELSTNAWYYAFVSNSLRNTHFSCPSSPFQPAPFYYHLNLC